MARIKLSRNFYLDEFTRSETAARHGIEINVELGSEFHRNLIDLCKRILQPLRAALGPVFVTSGYRPPKVNALVGGSKASSHLTGCAADIVVSGHAPLDVARWINAHIDSYDQVIHEFGQWTHVSIAPASARERRHALTAIKVRRYLRTRTVYVPGLYTVEAARLEAELATISSAISKGA